MVNIFSSKFYVFTIISFLKVINQGNSQPIPEQYFENKIKQFRYNNGDGWDHLSSIISNRYNNKTEKINFSNAKNYFSLSYSSNEFSLSTSSNFYFKGDFYGYFDLKLFNKYDANSTYEEKRELASPIFRTSGIGFQNQWVTLQIGKGIESWGAGENIQLGISSNSNLYDYFMLSSDYGNIRVNYIHGYLETIAENINRYINARGIEWTNKKSVVVSLSETIIYSGQNRTFEFSYLNPIASHLEIELNNRLRENGSSSANAIWQFHADLFLKNKSRLSINYLIDEFVLDREIEVSKENGVAYSFKYIFPFQTKIINQMNFYLKSVFVGTPTLRHGRGANNFVQNGNPLGWAHGSDGRENGFGIKYISDKETLFDLYVSYVVHGSESIILRAYEPYEDYEEGTFPSGDVQNYLYLNKSIFWQLSPRLTIRLVGNYRNTKDQNILDVNLGLDLKLKNKS